MINQHSVQLVFKQHYEDVTGARLSQKAQQFLQLETGSIRSSKLFVMQTELKAPQVEDFAKQCLADGIVQEVLIDEIAVPKGFRCYICISKQAGVTDDEGVSAQRALADFSNQSSGTASQFIFSKELYYLEAALTEEQLKNIAQAFLANELIHRIDCGALGANAPVLDFVPQVQLKANPGVKTIRLDVSDLELINISKAMLLALNLEEMKAIQKHFLDDNTRSSRQKLGLPAMPTDCEIEVLAQTWSEHCKHKEFNADIEFNNKDIKQKRTVNSLFKTYIKGATDKVKESLEAKGNDWLIKVFNDNAGIVRINEDNLFVWKVETHNSPSALDPYGGAITGILGNNRDPLGTGVGGAKLLFNTNVLCFGNPDYEGPLVGKQLHPRRIFAGVREGIEAGGNKSGIPTVNGSIIFDDRYSGKPLVYCGTGGVMPPQYMGMPSWEKPIAAGDRIVMAGGRVGKDGIHGATFSSIEIDENSPSSAVQIGSPITQKLLSDFLQEACLLGLIKCSTDNGAGGLSSSVGELATISGGARVDLEKVPLKYPGLQPWEIFVSESQERMTLVIEADKLTEVYALAERREVELSDIGVFSDDGFLDVRYQNEPVCYLSMDFLHEGVPTKQMLADWKRPKLDEPALPRYLDYNQVLLALLNSLNICSRETVIRQYDHEVKGKTIIKPLMGRDGAAPQDAAVVRLNFDSFEGIAVSNGIIPRYGDIDPYQMSAGAFDEGIRQIIAVGGSLPNLKEQDGIFWSVNDNFCVPDSEYHEKTNPDGKRKLGKLVLMCEALYDMATYFDIPLTSGKDSMKNDFKAEGVKISVPPTVLYSMAAKIPDVRKTITSNFLEEDDLIYQLGFTYNELGGSEFYKLFDKIGANVPQVRKEQAKEMYKRISEANELELISSCHDISDGGLAVAISECCFGAGLGADIEVNQQAFQDLSLSAILFSESHSRFIVSIHPDNKNTFEVVMDKFAIPLGKVNRRRRLLINQYGDRVIMLGLEALLQSWRRDLRV